MSYDGIRSDSYDHKIDLLWKSLLVGVASTVAGSVNGYADGAGTNAKFNGPHRVSVDSNGVLYIADHYNNRIRKQDVSGGCWLCAVMLHVSECCGSGIVSTIAGSGSGYADGVGTSATFNAPYDIAVDSTGNLFVVEYNNHIIRRISPSGRHCFVRYDSILLIFL